MIEKKPIKVILYRRPELNKNTASFNRNEMVEEMLCSTFRCEVFRPSNWENYSKNRYLRGLKLRLSSYWQLHNLISLTKDKSYNYVLFIFPLDPFTVDPFIDLATSLFAKLLKIKVVTERNEYPYVFSNGANSFKKILYRLLLLPWHYRVFNALFIMTDELINFYGKHASKKCIIQKLPMTVDLRRFDNTKKDPGVSYIFYSGSLLERKDGVESLIHAFSKIAYKHTDLFLKIANSAENATQVEKLDLIIKRYGLFDRVILLGSVDRDSIPKLLFSAKILVLARPDSLQARGGFPTKLGEYLASGQPVIVTRVGEIPKILLEDQVYFINPLNLVAELAAKIDFILSNYAEALKIGANGKKAAIKNFSLESNRIKLKIGIEKLFSI